MNVSAHTAAAAELASLHTSLGDPSEDWVILAEGNASARVDDRTMLIKASGQSMRDATEAALAAVDLAAVLGIVRGGTEAEWEGLIETASLENGGLRPSVEMGMHAVALDRGGARFVAHTHPSAVNAILCSHDPQALVRGHLFPDQIVVCGRHPMLLEYVDPGRELARVFDRALEAHIEEHGSPPQTVYLRNHGLVALGSSATEALQITAMAVKAARILLGALAAGGASYMPEVQADRIDGREDEAYRRSMLARSGGSR